MAEDANPAPVTDDNPSADDVEEVPDTPLYDPGAKETEGEDNAEETKEEPKPEEGKSEAPAEGEQQEEEATEDAPDPKEVARRSYAERQRLKAQTQQAVAQQMQPQTADELEQQGYDPRDAQIEALRQRVEANETASNVADLTANMSMDAATVEQELDVFNQNSPNFDKDFAEKVSREYIRDAQVQFDESGQYVMSARIPMYDYYKSRYEDRMSGMKRGQISGQKAAEQMLASADTVGSGHQAAPADEDEALFNRIKDVRLS